jgi:hypothetical protein
MSPKVEKKFRELAKLPIDELYRHARFYYESTNVPFDCEERLCLGDSLRDLAEIRRLWELPDTRPGSGDL